MNIRGIILTCLFSCALYFMGLLSGACGIASAWEARAGEIGYRRGYEAGAKAYHEYLRKLALAQEIKEL